MASQLTKSLMAEKMELEFNHELNLLHQQLAVKDQIESNQAAQIENLNQLVNNHKQAMDFYQSEIGHLSGKVKRQKWGKVILGFSSLLSTTLLLIK